MRKTPSYLKGLAETRARAAAEVQYLQKLVGELSQDLATAQAELEACDRLIRKYDERLNPTLIEPIKAWKGRYGPRGKLKETIIRLLKERYPESMSTRELLIKLQVELHLDFITPAERMDWKRNSPGYPAIVDASYLLRRRLSAEKGPLRRQFLNAGTGGRRLTAPVFL